MPLKIQQVENAFVRIAGLCLGLVQKQRLDQPREQSPTTGGIVELQSKRRMKTLKSKTPQGGDLPGEL